ncbi:hypothetical protein B0H14DRAFT_2641984 [Mycena olivaceomarginata]|nr:hypothetical protein B0H14DRAFT_2641984 [Mycena olivaceomarginata]
MCGATWWLQWLLRDLSIVVVAAEWLVVPPDESSKLRRNVAPKHNGSAAEAAFPNWTPGANAYVMSNIGKHHYVSNQIWKFGLFFNVLILFSILPPTMMFRLIPQNPKMDSEHNWKVAAPQSETKLDSRSCTSYSYLPAQACEALDEALGGQVQSNSSTRIYPRNQPTRPSNSNSMDYPSSATVTVTIEVAALPKWLRVTVTERVVT